MSLRDQRGERGSALFVAMMLLMMMGLIGFAALDTVTRDLQVAGFQNRKRTAFYAAEAGIAMALDQLRASGNPAVPPANLSDAATYPYGQPSYALDPSAATPVEDLGLGAVSGMNLAIGGGGPSFAVRYWRVRVEGQAPGGSRSRLEAVAGVLEGS